MKRKNINPEKAKILSTLLVGLIFMTTVLSVSSAYTKGKLKAAKNEYFYSLRSTLNVFSKIISIQLEDYTNSLNSFFVDKALANCDTNEIFEYIQQNDFKKHEDFLDLYYILPDGTAYLSSGEIIKMSPERHIGLQGVQEYFISGLCIPTIRDEKIFCIERTVYNDKNEIAGALGVSVVLDDFKDRVTGIRVGERESFMLIDKTGVFLIHPDRQIIGKIFFPEDPKYEDISTVNMAKNPAGTYNAITDTGEKIYLLTAKIRESGWTLSLKISLNELEKIYAPQKRFELVIILISVGMIFLLVIIEAKVLDFFQRKQLIATVYDSLTNLWTRQRFEHEASKFIRFNPHSKFLLIEADIRGFKFINQNYGEDAADKLILFYSKILNNYASMYHAIIGRGFADHFYILIKIPSVHRAMNTFKKNLNDFSDQLKDYEIPFFPKFGLAFLMPDGKSKGATIQTLIGQASFAKSTIRDTVMTKYAVYNSRLLGKVSEETFIESHMQQALENNEFFVMYQPKISLMNDKIVGAEALVRWKSPKLGLLTPDTFIPLFERNGFITKIDYYVYEEVFKFIQRQIDNKEPVVPVSVNMSRNHNKPEKFMHDFMEIFKKYTIPSSMVQIEIIERSVMDNSTLQNVTDMLHKEGFSVAMDDFGSGESSLNMLTKVPVDVLKFDREFLKSFTDKTGQIDSHSAKFIHILIKLSKHLKKQTVFEGVETQAQRDFLRSIDCDQAQGYFYSKPLTEAEFIEFVRSHQ